MHNRTDPVGPSLCSSLYTSEVTEIRPVDRNISFCLSSSGRFVFQTIFMRSHYFHFLSCHLVLGFFRSVHTGIAPVLIWSQGPSERKCISITKGYITKDWRFSTVKYHWFCSNASIFFTVRGRTRPNWNGNQHKNGPLITSIGWVSLLQTLPLNIANEITNRCVPQHHGKMEMHGVNSCMKALLVLLKNSTDSRRRNPPWYYSLRQVKRWESASVSQKQGQPYV